MAALAQEVITFVKIFIHPGSLKFEVKLNLINWTYVLLSGDVSLLIQGVSSDRLMVRGKFGLLSNLGRDGVASGR